MKNILITGGAGFVGSHLALRLIQLGYRVRVLDNLSEQIHGKDPVTTSPLYASVCIATPQGGRDIVLRVNYMQEPCQL